MERHCNAAQRLWTGRQGLLLADIVEKVFSGGLSKFLEAAGALIEKGAGAHLPKHQFNDGLPLIFYDGIEWRRSTETCFASILMDVTFRTFSTVSARW
jgi:hypothetical protein